MSTMQAFQNTKGKGKTICKRTIKNSVWSHLYKTQEQDDDTICWVEKADYQVKETTADQTNKCKPVENRLGTAKNSNNDKKKRLQHLTVNAKEKDK